MKVLMISGDKNVLTQGSEAEARIALQRSQVDQLDVFVWPQVHSLSEIYKAANLNRYDVVTAQDPFWRGFIAWRVAKSIRAKLNLQIHTDLSAQSFFRWLLAYALLQQADSVRVVSEKIRNQVQGIGVKAPIHVVPIYVDIRRFQNLKPEPHMQKTILWIGRFESEKDPLSAVNVLKEVRTGGLDAKLIILGAGTLEPTIRKLAGNLPIELPGWQNPESYLSIADVVLCTSKHESWGASILEALAAGVPVVSPDIGIAKEAGAIIVPRSDLAAMVSRVLNSGQQGALKISLSNAEEWAKRWKETLV